MNSTILWEDAAYSKDGKLSIIYNDSISLADSSDEGNTLNGLEGSTYNLTEYIGNDYVAILEGVNR